MIPASPQLCPGRVYDGEFYACGRTVLYRDPAKKEGGCPGGLFVCGSCVDDFGDFMKVAYDAQAVRQEWDGSDA
jgi:hypothetical protein